MNAPIQNRLQFGPAEEDLPDEPLMLDLDVWEGPLHVLLELARAQKVDLMALSITRLCDQFLAFVRHAKRRRFSLAADYLVMASWLAYLKSRLLLPKPPATPEIEPSADEVAKLLAVRLLRLDAVRKTAAALEAGPILRRDVFPRGDPEATVIVSNDILEGDLHGLMTAYVEQRRRASEAGYRPPVTPAWRLDDARDHLRRALPRLASWTPLKEIPPAAKDGGPSWASLTASTLSASLEFVREGDLDMRQLAPFAELYLRARAEA